MTFVVYVNTSKQVGDVEHIKVFATTEVAEVFQAFQISVCIWKNSFDHFSGSDL